jgi:hypothetical protein
MSREPAFYAGSPRHFSFRAISALHAGRLTRPGNASLLFAVHETAEINNLPELGQGAGDLGQDHRRKIRPVLTPQAPGMFGPDRRNPLFCKAVMRARQHAFL